MQLLQLVAFIYFIIASNSTAYHIMIKIQSIDT